MSALRHLLPLALGTAALWACDDGGSASQDPTPIDQGPDQDAQGMGGAGGEGGMGGEGGAGGMGGEGGAGGMGGEGGAGGMGGEGGAGGGVSPTGCSVTVPTTVDTIEIGQVEVPNGQSQDFTFDLPDDVISATIIAVEVEESALIGVGKLIGPEGQVLITDNPEGGVDPITQFITPFPGPFSSPNRMAVAATGVGATLAPNNPDVTVSPGTWTAQLVAADGQTGRPATTAAQVTVHIKRAAGAPDCGLLDVHLYFTGAEGWTAATAPDDERFQQALARMAEFYNEIGIGLGEITYEDVDAPLTVGATGGPGSDLHDLYAECTHEDGVCLFFVERISSPFGGGGDQGGIGGIAGGVPGPNLLPGTARSGVVVATTIAAEPEALGHVMGHETGHYLGLFHTREFTGTEDQIPDTGSGEDNLMFPTVTSEPASLSDGQAFVLHRNATIYTPEAD